MAPDVALEKIESLTTPGAVVLDPMCGSGTVPRLAVAEERNAIACDLDPLAVQITRTVCKPHWSNDLSQRAQDVITTAKRLKTGLPHWIAHDPASESFVGYWFALAQQDSLSRIARVLYERPWKDDPLRIALSRLIVTKEGGASLARDTSHSRPHRVRLENDFDVYSEFAASAKRVESLAGLLPKPESPASIRAVDARSLGFIPPSSVDLTVTSPPYLNAIDYLRGHRMSLVWLGWTITELRGLRGVSIGTERGLWGQSSALLPIAEVGVPRLLDLSAKEQRMVLRYTRDLDRLCRSISRVVRSGGHLVFVVADSQLRGVPVSNSALCKALAAKHGFGLEEGIMRPLPAQHRYLPPPETETSMLSSRMREEVVLTFRKVCATSPVMTPARK
jgi:SAM-dependent methyltransferase